MLVHFISRYKEEFLVDNEINYYKTEIYTFKRLERTGTMRVNVELTIVSLLC